MSDDTKEALVATTSRDATPAPPALSKFYDNVIDISRLYNNVIQKSAMSPVALGSFEHQVLLAILRLGSESYSVEIVRELERLTGNDVATSAVFVALQRLQAKDLLADRMVAPGEEGGHKRRYFRLTNSGMDALRDSRKTLQVLWDGVEAVLDES
jgi:DNA-binding PadR family transcriptional regulator